MEEFAAFLKKQRAENATGENELYAKWQGPQYKYSMFTIKNTNLVNDRHKGLSRTKSLDCLKSFVKYVFFVKKPILFSGFQAI